jgi:hypothetical protein
MVLDDTVTDIAGAEITPGEELQHIPLTPRIVDTRLNLVDVHYYDITGTLTLDVETRVTDGMTHTIIGFQNAFELDETFTAQVIDVELSNQVFVNPTYLVSEVYAKALDGSLSQLRYIYTQDQGTAVTFSGSEWSPVLRATVTFTQVRATGAITWSPDSHPPKYMVLDDTVTDIAGAEITPGEELQHIPLTSRHYVYLPAILKIAP